MNKTAYYVLTGLTLLFLTACGTTIPADTGMISPEPVSKSQVEAEIVTYYCANASPALANQIAIWNETTGATQKIEIQLTTRCNCGRSLDDHLRQGDAWDLIDTGNDISFLENGWVKDLETISDPQIQTLLDSYRPLLVPGVTTSGSMTMGVPKDACPIKLAVNLDLFEKNSLELPTTWEDVVKAARSITEHGDGRAFGWGCSIWSGYYRQFILKGTVNSLEHGYWDPNTEQYSFSQYAPVIQALAEMYADGSILGFDTMGLDELRSRFSDGQIGMMPALGYDFTVYTQQFPAECRYTFIDMPVIDPTETYPGIYLTTCGPSICAPLYDAADDTHKEAVEEAWLFLNSDELNRTLYQLGCIIPCKRSLMEDAPLLFTEQVEQWMAISDLRRCTAAFTDPDEILTVGGNTYDAVFTSVIRGEQPWSDTLFSDLEAIYQAAYQQAAEARPAVRSLHHYSYSR